MMAGAPNCHRRHVAGIVCIAAAAIGLAACAGREQADTSDSARLLLEAFEQRESGFMVTTRGEVVRMLTDDEVGSRHQRFVIRIDPEMTLLISHNIDLADRVPVESGDMVEVRGQYEWNQEGGVLHWTHHDPDGRRPGGWIRHRDRQYR